jgi:WD40 repeat protein
LPSYDPHYRALLIGNHIFPQNPRNLPELNGPLPDLDAMKVALCDGEAGLFSPENAHDLPDATSVEMKRAVQHLFKSANRDDTVLLYYTGHGREDIRGNLYLCANDTETDYLQSTAMDWAFIRNAVEDSAAKATVIILDCCKSGNFKGGGDVGSISGEGRFILASTRAGENSGDADAPKCPSWFTAALVEGLRSGASDFDKDGRITFSDLYKYTTEQLKPRGQVPRRGGAHTGDVLMALSPLSQNSRHGTLSESLQTALESPYANDHIRAVKVLGEWLAGDDPARTAAALSHPPKIDDNDAPRVTDAARALLRPSMPSTATANPANETEPALDTPAGSMLEADDRNTTHAEDNDTAEKSQTEQEIALSLEFDRTPGNGLTREEALQACRRHGFSPQTIDAWVSGNYLVIRDDGLRYLGKAGVYRVEKNGGKVENGRSLTEDISESHAGENADSKFAQQYSTGNRGHHRFWHFYRVIGTAAITESRLLKEHLRFAHSGRLYTRRQETKLVRVLGRTAIVGLLLLMVGLFALLNTYHRWIPVDWGITPSLAMMAVSVIVIFEPSMRRPGPETKFVRILGKIVIVGLIFLIVDSTVFSALNIFFHWISYIWLISPILLMVFFVIVIFIGYQVSRALRARRLGLVVVGCAAVAAGITFPLILSQPGGASGQPQNASPSATLTDPSATLTDPVAYGGGDVQAAVFSPDGKMVATVDSNGSAYLWDLASPSHPVATITDPVPALAGDAGVSGLVFSPDGKMVATADADNSAYVWDLASLGHPVATLTDPDSNSLTIGVSGLAFSPDGKMVATGDGNGSAYLWDLASPSHPVATLTDPDSNSFNGGVNDVAFSPDGKMVATADANDGAYLWDVASPSHPVATLTNPDPQAGDGGVSGLAFSPDGKIVATADGNGSAYLWDVASPSHLVATLTVPDGDTLYDVAFSPDGKMVATADADNSAYLWDVANPGHPVATITDPRSSAVSSVAFSPDGKMVATADDSVSAYLWKLAQPLTDP